jgi:Arc/MetJ-type ribon-helix-helix transcriptional regulator
VGTVHNIRTKTADSEKITINLGYVDLGHIDLMVKDGFYSNRTDFIRTAIRNQLDRHADVVRQSVARDVTPELARATIASVTVLGALHASAEVKAALADRTN